MERVREELAGQGQARAALGDQPAFWRSSRWTVPGCVLGPCELLEEKSVHSFPAAAITKSHEQAA